jgi:hypothetical protein
MTMGMMTEQNMLTQLKKAQGETNQRLDAILAELQAIHHWLEHMARYEAERVGQGLWDP